MSQTSKIIMVLKFYKTLNNSVYSSYKTAKTNTSLQHIWNYKASSDKNFDFINDHNINSNLVSTYLKF